MTDEQQRHYNYWKDKPVLVSFDPVLANLIGYVNAFGPPEEVNGRIPTVGERLIETWGNP